MYLGNEDDTREITAFIKKNDGMSFLTKLYEERVAPLSKPTICPCCKKSAGRETECWMLTDAAGKPVFRDLYDSQACAVHAIARLKQFYESFLNYLGVRTSGDNLSEDELRDPLTQRDDESKKKFRNRKDAHLERLEEITPQINLELDRLEDHL